MDEDMLSVPNMCHFISGGPFTLSIGKIEILCEDIKESKYIATYMYVPPFCCIMFLEKSDLGILPLSGIPSGSLLFVAFNNWDLSKSKLYLQQIYNEQMITHDENYLLQVKIILSWGINQSMYIFCNNPQDLLSIKGFRRANIEAKETKEMK